MTERNHKYKILTYSWLGFPASLFQPANLRLYLTQTWRFNISWNLQYHQFLYFKVKFQISYDWRCASGLTTAISPNFTKVRSF